MNYYHLLTTAAPDISFSSISFDRYLEQLSVNFVVAILAVIALFLVTILFYYAICYLVQVWNSIVGYSFDTGTSELTTNNQTTSLTQNDVSLF